MDEHTKLPQFAVGDNPLDRLAIIAIELLNGDQFRQTLTPPLPKVIFLGFDYNYQGKF